MRLEESIANEPFNEDFQYYIFLSFVVLVRRSVDTLHCCYITGIGQVHLILALVFVRFSYQYAWYMCVTSPQKFSSSTSVGIFKVCVL